MFIFLTAGNNDVAPEGKERIFLGFPHCRAALDLKKDQNYLIMGASKDIHVDRRDKLYVSMLMWVPWGDLRDLIGPTYSFKPLEIPNMCLLLHPSGISMFSAREPGLSTGQQSQSVRLSNTGPPVRAWKSWFRSTRNMAAGNKRKKFKHQRVSFTSIVNPNNVACFQSLLWSLLLYIGLQIFSVSNN